MDGVKSGVTLPESSTVTEELFGYHRGPVNTLLNRLKDDNGNWVFNLSVIMVVAMASVFLLMTALVLVGLVYVLRRREDIYHWQGLGSCRLNSDLASSTSTDARYLEERNVFCEGHKSSTEETGVTADDRTYNATAALCHDCRQAFSNETPHEYAIGESGKFGTESSHRIKAKAIGKSKTMISIKKNARNYDPLLPRLSASSRRGKSTSYSVLKDVEAFNV